MNTQKQPGTDCTLEIDDGFLNLRVGAIIQKGDQFLMVGNDRDDYLYSVGGRIHFGETAREAILREVEEETGVRLEIDRLGFLHENLFYADYRDRKRAPFYETSYYFYMKIPEDFCPVCDSFTEGAQKERLVWVTKDTEQTLYPEFFRTELEKNLPGVQYIVTDERQSEKTWHKG